MNTININERFGDAAAGRLATLLTEPPLSEAFVGVDVSATGFSLADPDRLLGSLMGVAIGEAAGEPVEGRSSEWIERRCGVISSYLNNQPSAGSDTVSASASWLCRRRLPPLRGLLRRALM